jgi:hypothetical protein
MKVAVGTGAFVDSHLSEIGTLFYLAQQYAIWTISSCSYIAGWFVAFGANTAFVGGLPFAVDVIAMVSTYLYCC